MFDFESLENIDNEKLINVLKLIQNPPVNKGFITNIHQNERIIPPQPVEEYLETDFIQKKLNINKGINLFLTADEIIGLMPTSIKKEIFSKYNLEIFRE